MNRLITNILLAPTPSAAGTIGSVVEHEVIVFGLPPIAIRSNPGHPTVFKLGGATFLVMVGCTFLGVWVGRTFDTETLTLVAITLQIDSFTWTIGPVLSPSLVMAGGSSTPVLVLLVILIVQGGINRSCGRGGRSCW